MPPRGGISRRNLSKELLASLLPEQATVALQQALRDSIARRPGVRASNVMVVPASVVNGDTITIGDDIFEVDIINTDSLVNTANTDDTGPLAASVTTSLLTTTAAPATAISAGDVLGVESELMLVLRKISTTQYVVSRGYANTAVAAHAKNLDILVSDTVPTNISVPLVTTLTPAAFCPAFEAVFNYVPPTGEDYPARTQTEGQTHLIAYELGSKLQVLVAAQEAGVDVTATTEDFSNSTDNVWAAATLTGGADPVVGAVEVAERAATAAEELAGDMHFAFPFTVAKAVVQMRVTSTGQLVAFTGQVLIAYAETTAEVLPATIVTLRNTGPASTAYVTPYASTHTLTVMAFE